MFPFLSSKCYTVFATYVHTYISLEVYPSDRFSDRRDVNSSVISYHSKQPIRLRDTITSYSFSLTIPFRLIPFNFISFHSISCRTSQLLHSSNKSQHTTPRSILSTCTASPGIHDEFFLFVTMISLSLSHSLSLSLASQHNCSIVTNTVSQYFNRC